ncbi:MULTISPECIES: superinfection immunity protein [Streptomyces]|uniref:superinfection immunity protein n=1 Tax=Streptomyces TaxID=1883 RepID=UPI0004C6FE9F|nr:superinfection immunity protein [Streptomyces sp. NRRL S-15]
MISTIRPLELLVLVPVALLVLCLPSVVAYRRGVERLGLVIMVSLIGAVTGVFWFVALVMALSMRTHGHVPTLRPSD